ncbi:arylsulfatase regulator, partial [Vibrio anguillarum]|nr:arylsulfatase regulator [Vibrio anguillarum]
MVYLTTEQQQLVQIVNDYAYRFPLTEDGDAQL